MTQATPFHRAKAMMAAISALIAAGNSPSAAATQVGPYRSRGKGEGLPGNKHAKSSFKQNKRRGL